MFFHLIDCCCGLTGGSGITAHSFCRHARDRRTHIEPGSGMPSLSSVPDKEDKVQYRLPTALKVIPRSYWIACIDTTNILPTQEEHGLQKLGA